MCFPLYLLWYTYKVYMHTLYFVIPMCVHVFCWYVIYVHILFDIIILFCLVRLYRPCGLHRPRSQWSVAQIRRPQRTDRMKGRTGRSGGRASHIKLQILISNRARIGFQIGPAVQLGWSDANSSLGYLVIARIWSRGATTPRLPFTRLCPWSFFRRITCAFSFKRKSFGTFLFSISESLFLLRGWLKPCSTVLLGTTKHGILNEKLSVPNHTCVHTHGQPAPGSQKQDAWSRTPWHRIQSLWSRTSQYGSRIYTQVQNVTSLLPPPPPAPFCCPPPTD
jgi:hypothetical protein